MIELHQVSKDYDGRLAVDNLSVTIHPGLVTGFLGPNGAGKTTTMRMILGLTAPASGTVTVNGHHYSRSPAPMHEVGALLDNQAVHGLRRARDHLLCLAYSNGIAARRVDEVLGITGLADVAQRPAGTFSLGMRQRLGIAQALLGDPEVLMLDEPVNGLDPEGIRWFRTLMRELAAEGRTIFLSSHLMSEMALTADYLVIIARGRLVADTSLVRFGRQHSQRSVAVRLLRAIDLPELRSRLEAAGADVTLAPDGMLTVTGAGSGTIGKIALAHGIALAELTPRQVSLEDAFLQVTRDDTDFVSAGLVPAGRAR